MSWPRAWWPCSPLQAAALAALEADPTRGPRSFARGFLAGEAPGAAGAAGAVTGDLVGYGDLRDLFQESRKVAQGLDPDPVTVTLAAAGVVLTGATWASLGGALPARGGLSAVKAAHRAGDLSPPLRASLARLGAASVDRNQAARALADLRRLDLDGAEAAVRQAIRPAGVAALRGLTADVGTLYARTGAGGVRQALAVAENTDDLRRTARLAEAQGPRARGMLALLGRGALVVGAMSMAALGWIAAAAFYLIAMAAMLVRGALWLRRVRRRAVPAR